MIPLTAISHSPCPILRAKARNYASVLSPHHSTPLAAQENWRRLVSSSFRPSNLLQHLVLVLAILRVSHTLRPLPVTLLVDLSDTIGISDTSQLLNQLADGEGRWNLVPRPIDEFMRIGIVTWPRWRLGKIDCSVCVIGGEDVGKAVQVGGNTV